MAGLLDRFFDGEPRQQGLLAGGMALLNAGGPSRTPVSFGQALAQGWGAGQQAYQSAQENALWTKLREARLQKLLADAEQRQRDEQRRRQQLQASMSPQLGAVEGLDTMPPEDMTLGASVPPGVIDLKQFVKPRVSKLLNPMLPAIKRNMLVNKPPKPFRNWPGR